MQLIVVSYPDAIANEAKIINSLFDEGLELFHLRKPGASENELANLLNRINSNHYSKIAIHQYHSMAGLFGIKRIHFSETNRLKLNEEKLRKWEKENYILSTSIHSINDCQSLEGHFTYTFLGPVFESISKPGYTPQANDLIRLKEKESRTVKIIAIGGIAADKIEKVEQANFDGVALLGAIWKDTTRAIKNFKECRQTANMY